MSMQVRCLICSEILSCDPNDTANLVDHVRIHHPEVKLHSSRTNLPEQDSLRLSLTTGKRKHHIFFKPRSTCKNKSEPDECDKKCCLKKEKFECFEAHLPCKCIQNHHNECLCLKGKKTACQCHCDMYQLREDIKSPVKTKPELPCPEIVAFNSAPKPLPQFRECQDKPIKNKKIEPTCLDLLLSNKEVAIKTDDSIIRLGEIPVPIEDIIIIEDNTCGIDDQKPCKTHNDTHYAIHDKNHCTILDSKPCKTHDDTHYVIHDKNHCTIHDSKLSTTYDDTHYAIHDKNHCTIHDSKPSTTYDDTHYVIHDKNHCTIHDSKPSTPHVDTHYVIHNKNHCRINDNKLCTINNDNQYAKHDQNYCTIHDNDNIKKNKTQYCRKYCIKNSYPFNKTGKEKLYKTSIEKWRPGRSRICCPSCGALRRPLIKSNLERNATSPFGAACIVTCWPFCFLPCLFPPAAREYLHCSSCNTFLGIYDRKHDIIEPADLTCIKNS